MVTSPPGIAPAVSVIVPTCNRPALLRRALRSILGQTLEDFEVVVVSNGGPPVNEVVDGLDPRGRIRLLHNAAPLGVAAARNVGLRAARGNYIAYLDDDDVFFPEHLSVLTAALAGSDARLAYADARRAHTETDAEGELRVVLRDRPYSEPFDVRMLRYRNFIPTPCIVHERALIDEVGEFDETLEVAEDWELWCRMAAHTTFLHVPKVTCEFVIRSARDGGLSNVAAARFPRIEAMVRTRMASPLSPSGLAEEHLRRHRRRMLGRRFGAAEHADMRWALQTLLSQNPGNPQVAMDLAVLLCLEGQHTAATTMLMRIVSGVPSYLPARIALAAVLLLQDRGGQALSLLQPLADDAALSHVGRLVLGDCSLAAGDLDAAAAAYRQVVEHGAAASAGDGFARLSNLEAMRVGQAVA